MCHSGSTQQVLGKLHSLMHAASAYHWHMQWRPVASSSRWRCNADIGIGELIRNMARVFFVRIVLIAYGVLILIRSSTFTHFPGSMMIIPQDPIG